MAESEAHKLLKQRAKKELALRGFSKKEIFEEYRVNVGDQLYRIDIVGKRENEFVAFECGNAQIQKIADLERLFNDVVHLPYIAPRSVSDKTDRRRWVFWYINVPKGLYFDLEIFLTRSGFSSKSEFIREAVRDRLEVEMKKLNGENSRA